MDSKAEIVYWGLVGAAYGMAGETADLFPSSCSLRGWEFDSVLGGTAVFCWSHAQILPFLPPTSTY